MSIRPQQMEMFTASQAAERLGENDRLLDMILDRRNMFSALKQVRANKGAPAIDKISVKQRLPKAVLAQDQGGFAQWILQTLAGKAQRNRHAGRWDSFARYPDRP